MFPDLFLVKGFNIKSSFLGAAFTFHNVCRHIAEIKEINKQFNEFQERMYELLVRHRNVLKKLEQKRIDGTQSSN